MTTLETLTLADEPLPTVRVHPTAIFSILHSFMRRGCSVRTIGTLLGVLKEGSVEVFDCFEVPYDEKSEDMRVAINQEYHKRMYDFHRRINKREAIVGWYSTTTPEGEFINDTTYLFNDFYSKQCRKPIILVVDTSLSSDTFHIRAFQAKALRMSTSSVDDSFANLFVELKVVQELSEAESTCVYHMIKHQAQPAWQGSEILSTIPTEKEQLQESLETLVKVLDSLSSYVDDVVTGKQPGYASVGMKISDVLSSLSTVPVENMNAAYRDKIQDLLMVSYLSSLAKTQVLQSEKLNSIL